MFIGSFGIVVFTVSRDEVFTFRDLVRKRSVKYAEHEVIMGLSRLQHTGRNLDSLSLTVVFDNLYPSLPKIDARITQLLMITEAGEQQPLAFGKTYWGEWVLRNVDITHKEFHNGKTIRANVKLELLEYN